VSNVSVYDARELNNNESALPEMISPHEAIQADGWYDKGVWMVPRTLPGGSSLQDWDWFFWE
jgi:hypothetical protein